MEKFLGSSGEMVKPSAATVKTVVKKIAKGKLATLEQVREKLASDFDVQTACPASTMKVLKVLAEEEPSVCYWRVIKKKGELITKFPNGVQGHALLLKNEGFEIDFEKKTPVVIDYETKLFNFA